MMKDLIGFATLSIALVIGFGGIWLYGQTHVAVVALILLVSALLLYTARRLLVAKAPDNGDAEEVPR